MGWFNKKSNEGKKLGTPGLPTLPELPELPELGTKETSKLVPQLPSFPNNSLGDKFSQNTIKEAVTGKKEGEEVFDADEFEELEEIRRMPKPLKKQHTHEIEDEEEEEFEEPHTHFKTKIPKKGEPIFIRIDKFEEGLHVFKKTKDKVSEVEKMLRDIKILKDEEEKELGNWEKEIQEIKEQIEKVNKDIFSKVE